MMVGCVAGGSWTLEASAPIAGYANALGPVAGGAVTVTAGLDGCLAGMHAARNEWDELFNVPIGQ